MNIRFAARRCALALAVAVTSITIIAAPAVADSARNGFIILPGDNDLPKPYYPPKNFYDSMVVFGDSLNDNGNAGIFTNKDPQGIYPQQPAVAFLADQLGVSKSNSCFGLGLPVKDIGILPCLPTTNIPAQAAAQAQASGFVNGPNWAVGGHKAADVLLDLVGPQRFRELFATTTLADHNLLSIFMPDSSRCGADGICDPAAGKLPYLTPADRLLVEAAIKNKDFAALQVLIDDPNNSITLTGVPFANGQGYLPQNKISRDRLFFLDGGGNDIIRDVEALTVSPESMELAAIFLATAVSELKAADARYVVLSNAPSVGRLPSINDAGPAAVRVADQSTALFNESLRQQVNEVGNVLLMDLAGILEVITAQPARFGLADIPQSKTCYAAGACANPNPIYSEGGSAPNPNLLLFNDGIHPTLVAQRMLADYYFSVLTAPIAFGLMPDLAYRNTRQHQLNLDQQLLSQRFRKPYTSVFLGAGVGRRGIGTPRDRSTSWDGFVGMSFAGFKGFEWGLGLSAGDSEYELHKAYLDSRNINLSAFSRWDNGSFFADGGLTYAFVDYKDVHRRLDIGNTFSTRYKANPDGEVLSLFARAGYDSVPQLSCKLGPFVAAEYTRAKVDKFSEKTRVENTYRDINSIRRDPFGLDVNRQERDYQRYRGGFFYNSAESAKWRWYGEVWLEHNRGDDRADVGIGLKSIRGNRAYMKAYDSENAGFFQNGAGALVGINITDKLNISGNLLVHRKDTVSGLNLYYRF